jgi:hypothetical protein
MDDIVLVAPTRWQCGVVKVVDEMLGALSLERNPDKTFIGGSNAPLISSTITSRVKG